ncbi:hypothetical protein CA13_73560 [Planctomycetes bacterium CA13]|uniref:Uncharacterized protein n=1 Tax=Novipirellula herctigrandis TaxID=2527986 RepID=A0A5C5YLG2_9BACT|nr:hypothetical protein CA13_73560 [Planctomycetes bacterium CA13]
MVNLGGRWNASLRSKARPRKPMVTGDCSRKPSGRSVVEQRMSSEHADRRCEEARASHQEIGRSNQKSCPREWFVGYIVHRHQPQASVVTPRPNTSIPIGVDRITIGISGRRELTLNSRETAPPPLRCIPWFCQIYPSNCTCVGQNLQSNSSNRSR